MEVVAENVVVPQQKKQKFTDTLYFYRTYNDNEYINQDGDVIYKFEKITNEKLYFNSTSFRKLEEDDNWSIVPNNSKNSKWFKIIKKCVDKDLFVIHHEEINSLTLKKSTYKVIFHNSPYIYYLRNYKNFNDSGFYDDM